MSNIYSIDICHLGCVGGTSKSMANHWFYIFFGVTLLQGSFPKSPIPVPEEEWEEFYRMMRDSSYRLPKTSHPRHYEVSLTPYFDQPPVGVQPFTFDGTVKIYTFVNQASINEIVIHCNDLTILSLTIGFSIGDTFLDVTTPNQNFACEMPYSFLRIRTAQPLVTREYEITATFRGNLQTNMRGFYRSWYVDRSGERRWMGTTQFQPGHARQAFPCYDEPGFKATFDITIIREESFSDTISNMPKRTEEFLENGTRIAETFHTTPKTSTYLLAFIVSHYIEIETNNNTERPFAIYARDNADDTGKWALEIGEKLLLEMEQHTNYLYYSMATNMSMKQAAIPDFSAGAMENWGLLTYREALILYDEQNSNHFYKQRVANIVSHEIAHMWFGNLVTCAWWDVLWLNEGFARFYQYYLTAKVVPELGYETRFITEQLHVSMLSDSVDSAHPLVDPRVEDPTTVSAHFSTITYAKGASILRMTQHLLGEETYVKALRNYLKDRDFDVAEPFHLYQAFDDAATEDRALSAYSGISIDQYFRTWSENAGHPILTVRIDQNTGQMIVTQARFERNSGYSYIRTLYHIPITWTRGGAPDFINTKPVAILTNQVTVLERGTSGNEWVIFNKQNTGFYRVNYDFVNWALITQALRGTNRTLIHEYNSANIVDDVFVFARASILPYNRAFNILSFLEFEDAYAPWDAAITGLNFVIRRVAHDRDNLQKLYDVIETLSTTVVDKLGYIERNGEPYMDGLQRMYVMQFLCNANHPGCKAAGRQNFQNWKNGVFLPANMRPWVWCEGLRQGDATDFDFFWNEYLQNDLSNDQVVMLQNAGCTGNQTSLEKLLDAIMEETDTVRLQDAATALSSAVTGNEGNALLVFDWLKRNVAITTTRLGSIATPLSYIAARLINEQDIQEFERWVTENRALIGDSAYNTGISGAASARANLAWSANRIAELANYFETGYVEDDINPEESTPNATTIAPTEPPTTVTPEPDSANIAALSIITIFVTFAIHLLR